MRFKIKQFTSLLLCLLASCGLSFAQTLVGNQIPIKVKVASYGAYQHALLSLPDDYYVTAENYPLIIFLHGYGEIGSTASDLTKMIGQGLPKVISNGSKIQAVNPVDGRLYKFIVLSVQHHGWTTPPENIDFILSDFPKTYRIDTNRIYITGLSAGGQGVIEAVTYKQATTNKITAVVPMSPSAPDDVTLKKFIFFAENKPGAWFFSGKSDPGNYTANAKRYNDSIYKYNGGKSRVTLFDGGHCCWTDIYSPAYKEGGLSIYEWMLAQTRGGTPPVVDPEPFKYKTTILHDPRKIKQIIVLDDDGTWHRYDSTSYENGSGKMEMF